MNVLLVVLVHGLHGTNSDWDFVVPQLKQAFQKLQHHSTQHYPTSTELFVLPSRCNALFRTHHGLERMGDRLTTEIVEFIADKVLPSVRREPEQECRLFVSLVGHSLGGLLARYVIRGLFSQVPIDSKSPFWLQEQLQRRCPAHLTANLRLRPCSYMSIGTPHLGSRRPSSVTGDWWRRLTSVLATTYLRNLVGRTGHQLGLLDSSESLQASPRNNKPISWRNLNQEDAPMSCAEQAPHVSSQLEVSPKGSPEAIATATLVEEAMEEQREEERETAELTSGGLLMEMSRFEGAFGKALLQFPHLTLLGHFQDFTVPVNSATIRSHCPFASGPKPGLHILGASGWPASSTVNPSTTGSHILSAIFEKQKEALVTTIDGKSPLAFVGTQHHLGEPFPHNDLAVDPRNPDLRRCTFDDVEYSRSMMLELQKFPWRRITLDYGPMNPFAVLLVHAIVIGKAMVVVPPFLRDPSRESAQVIVQILLDDFLQELQKIGLGETS